MRPLQDYLFPFQYYEHYREINQFFNIGNHKGFSLFILRTCYSNSLNLRLTVFIWHRANFTEYSPESNVSRIIKKQLTL